MQQTYQFVNNYETTLIIPSCKLQTSRIYVTFLLSLKFARTRCMLEYQINFLSFFSSLPLYHRNYAIHALGLIANRGIDREREKEIFRQNIDKKKARKFSPSTLINMSRSTDHLHTFCIITLHKRCKRRALSSVNRER